MLVGFNPGLSNRTNYQQLKPKNQSKPAFGDKYVMDLKTIAREGQQAYIFETAIRFGFLERTVERVEQLTNFLKNPDNLKGADQESVLRLNEVIKLWGIKLN